MPLMNPTVAAPDTTGLMAQLKDLSSGLSQAAWARLQEPLNADIAAAQAAQARQMASQAGQPQQGYAGAVASYGGSTPGQGGKPMANSAAMEAYNNRLRELGYPEHFIQGNAWNVQDESGWNFAAVGDNGRAFGANQWNGPRKDALFAFARSRGVDPANPVVQADFLHHEATGPYAAVVQKAIQSGTPNGAALALLRGYEIPAQVHMDRRAADYAVRQAQGYGGFAPTLSSYGN